MVNVGTLLNKSCSAGLHLLMYDCVHDYVRHTDCQYIYLPLISPESRRRCNVLLSRRLTSMFVSRTGQWNQNILFFRSKAHLTQACIVLTPLLQLFTVWSLRCNSRFNVNNLSSQLNIKEQRTVKSCKVKTYISESGVCMCRCLDVFGISHS